MNDRSQNYMFVSYSHANDIKRFLLEFEKKGYNLVYDETMSYGEEWDLNARRYIQSEKCKGVIILVSDAALTSKPVLREMEYARQFGKKYIPVMSENLTLNELYNSMVDKLDENRKYILNSMMEFLSSEQLYISINDLKWDRIETAFGKLGFKPTTYNNTFYTKRYTSEIPGEKQRLDRQQMGYYEFDMQVINEVLDTFGRDNLCVLDLGCSDGKLTISRFSQDKRISKVIGVDYNEKDIMEAKRNAQEYGDKFKFYVVDLDSPNVIFQLAEILRENSIPKIDIVFSALVLHHLKAPKILLLKLYEIFSEDGKIILRGSDDGGKLCYPQSDLLDEIMQRYSKLITASDRSNGRKLYGQLYNTGYTGIKMYYSVSDTCERDRKSRDNMFKIGFGFRLNQLDNLIALNPDNEYLKNERIWLENALNKFREVFYERDFWYCVTSYIAVAGVKD